MAKILARPSPKIVIGNATRFDLVFKERQWRLNPGPGAYHTDNGTGVYMSSAAKKSGSRETTFNRSQRVGIEHYMGKDKDLIAEGPGPASYRLPKLIGDIPVYQLPKLKNYNKESMLSKKRKNAETEH